MNEKQLTRKLRGRLNFINIKKELNEIGYSVVSFNTPEGDVEIERYNLTQKAETTKGFTYASTVHVVFIDGNLHAEDKLYILLHEVGHIILGHIGDGNLITRNPILIDIEADAFAQRLLSKCNKPTILKFFRW